MAAEPGRDYEEEARSQGWKPKEEFGDDDKWVDAKTFVERGEQFVGILKPRIDKLERKLQYQEQVNRDIANQYKRLEESEKRKRQQLEEELVALRKKAIEENDGEAFEEADTQLNQLRQNKSPDTNTEATPPSWFNDWMVDNAWYGKDTVMRSVADGIAQELRDAGTYLTGREFMDAVSERVKAELPHKFENPRKARQSDPDVEPTGGRKTTVNSDAATWDNLPAEAKKECTRLIKEGVIKSKEQYAEIYYAE